LNSDLNPVLVLDLDGTLVDSKPDLVAAINVAITSVGLSEISSSAIGETVGQGARAMIARAHEVQDKPIIEDRFERIFDTFQDYYYNNVANFSKPYSGVQSALDKFANNGWALAVCTNKPENLAIALLRELDMGNQFAAVCGSDTFTNRKPHADHILKTIQTAGGRVQGSVMVGDTATDINAASNSGIPSIAVDFGYSAVPVDTLEASRVISHFDELWAAVNQL
jgi:phosphoglycolate phosphatase